MSQPQRIEPIEPSPPPRRDPAIDVTIGVLDLVFGASQERNYDVRLWEGTVLRGVVDPRADFSLNIRRRGALRRMLLPPSGRKFGDVLTSYFPSGNPFSKGSAIEQLFPYSEQSLPLPSAFGRAPKVKQDAHYALGRLTARV